MSDNLDEFTKKSQTRELQILKLEHWTWAVRPIPATLDPFTIT